MCTKEVDDIKIDYVIEENIFYIRQDDINMQYDVQTKTFDYSSPILSYTVQDDKMTCNSKKCDNYKDSYDKYYTKLIKTYLY